VTSADSLQPDSAPLAEHASDAPPGGPTPTDAERNRVIELVYERLERIARARLNRDPMGRVVRTRSLVHETVLRLQAQRQLDGADEAKALAAAANLMGQALVDLARKRRALKRGAGAAPVTLNTLHLIDHARPSVDAVEFADALEALAKVSAVGAQAIQMRFWADMTFEQMARALGVSEVEVKNKFNFAKAWLSRRLAGDERT
jgi:RNA polymerase sigma factor (TIGR02999 family)